MNENMALYSVYKYKRYNYKKKNTNALISHSQCRNNEMGLLYIKIFDDNDEELVICV